MSKDKALQAWFTAFGMMAYPSTSVPDDTVFPWLTYEYITGSFGDSDVAIVVNMWFWTESESIPNQKAEEFRKYILEHDLIECDEGLIWVKTGVPWCQSLTDETSPTVKRRYCNVTLEYLTR